MRRRSLRLCTVRSDEQAEIEASVVNRKTKSLYEDIFEDSRIRSVSVEHCVSIPELRTRPITSAGVKRFEHFINGGSLGSVTGHVSVGRKPLVTPLPASYRDSIIQYFTKKGRDPEMSGNWVEAHTFYHVIDGGHEHEAQWNCAERSGYKFTDYTWIVIEIKWKSAAIAKGISNITREL